MKVIGIDARFYGQTGPGRYAKNIVKRLEEIDTKNKYFVFLRKSGFESYIPSNPNFTKVLADFAWYSFEEQIFFLFQLLSYKLDLLYVPHFNIPLLYPGKIVTAIADLIMHSFSTEDGTLLPKVYYRFKRKIYYLVVFIALLRSEKVIVASNSTKNDLLKNYPFIAADKYVLAYEGVDPDLTISDVDPIKVLRKLGVRKPFILYISSMYKHKNVERLIHMYEILKDKFSFSGQLVLIGKKDLFSQKISDSVLERGLQRDILVPSIQNFVSDRETAVLRKEAKVYVFPSLKEGFSLTPLEAMSASLPCVISRIPCHEEVFDNSVIYFDPYDPVDMAEKVNMVMGDQKLRESLIKKGLEKVKEYSFTSTAKITLAVFEDILFSC